MGPSYAHRTALIMYDALKGYLNGGMSVGRRAEHDAQPMFRFRIEHNYYDEAFAVDIDIPDIEPSQLLTFDDLSVNALERQKLLLKIDGQAMPFRTALVLITIRLGGCEWWLKERRPNYSDAVSVDERARAKVEEVA